MVRIKKQVLKKTKSNTKKSDGGNSRCQYDFAKNKELRRSSREWTRLKHSLESY